MHLPTAPSQVSSYVIINVFKLQAPEHNFAWESCVIRDIGICGRIGEGGGALGGCAPQKFYVGSQCPHSGRLPNLIFWTPFISITHTKILARLVWKIRKEHLVSIVCTRAMLHKSHVKLCKHVSNSISSCGHEWWHLFILACIISESRNSWVM